MPQIDEDINWWSTKIYYPDTDLSGVVYHANYLRFYDAARTEALENYGFNLTQLLDKHKVQFAVADLNIDYKSSARLGDLLWISSKIVKVKRVSLEFEQVTHLTNKTGPIINAMTVRLACLDLDFKPAAMPEILQLEIKK